MKNHRERLKNAQTIVIKVGTSTITYDTGKLNFDHLKKLAFVISDLRNQGKKIILVSSGAICAGANKLALKERPTTMSEKQAAASIGQCTLMHIYNKLFSEYGYVVGQILLTREEIEVEERRNNVVNTINTLLKYNSIPIVNENDSIAVEEIEFGDNDTLSAVVSKLICADILIILSDIDGLYNADPGKNPTAKIISLVEDINSDIENSAGGAGSNRGTGGMITKIMAGKIATSAGTDVIVANGHNPNIIKDILSGQNIGTLFVSK